MGVKMREAVDAAMGNVCVSVCAGSSIPRRGGLLNSRQSHATKQKSMVGEHLQNQNDRPINLLSNERLSAMAVLELSDSKRREAS